MSVITYARLDTTKDRKKPVYFAVTEDLKKIRHLPGCGDHSIAIVQADSANV